MSLENFLVELILTLAEIPPRLVDTLKQTQPKKSVPKEPAPKETAHKEVEHKERGPTTMVGPLRA